MSLGTGIARVKHISNESEGLSFEKGDIVNILSTEGENFYAEIGGKIGYVPKQHLRLQSTGKCQVIETHIEGVEEGQLMLVQGDTIDILLKENERWYGRIQTTEGWFIPDFVREISKTTTESYTTPKLEPIHDKESSRPNVGDVKAQSLNLSSEDFNNVTSQASVLVDLRRNRARKPSARPVSKEHMLDMLADSEASKIDQSENLIDFDDVDGPKDTPDELYTPKKQLQSDPPWLSELKNKYPVGKQTHLRNEQGTKMYITDKEPLVEVRKKSESTVPVARNSRIEEATLKLLTVNVESSEKTSAKKPLQVKSNNFADIRKRFNSGGDNLTKEADQRTNAPPSNDVEKQNTGAIKNFNNKLPSFPLRTTKIVDNNSNLDNVNLIEEKKSITLPAEIERKRYESVGDKTSKINQPSLKENLSNNSVILSFPLRTTKIVNNNSNSDNVNLIEEKKSITLPAETERKRYESVGDKTSKINQPSLKENLSNNSVTKDNKKTEMPIKDKAANEEKPIKREGKYFDLSLEKSYQNNKEPLVTISSDTSVPNRNTNPFVEKDIFIADVVNKIEPKALIKLNNEKSTTIVTKDDFSNETDPLKVSLDLNSKLSTSLNDNTKACSNVVSKQNTTSNPSSDLDLKSKANLEERITVLEKTLEQCLKKVEKLSREMLSLKVSTLQ